MQVWSYFPNSYQPYFGVCSHKPNMELYMSTGCCGCKAVRLVGRTLGLDIKEHIIDMHKEQQKSKAYLKLNPCGIIPTLVDGDFVLWESRAIICYLSDKYGADSGLYPRQPEGRAMVDRLLYFDATSLYPTIQKWLYPQVLRKWPYPQGPEEQVRRSLTQLDQIFLDEESPYFSGNHVTVADFCLVASVSLLDVVDYDLSAWPRVQSWLARLHERYPFINDCVTPGLQSMKAMRRALMEAKDLKDQ